MHQKSIFPILLQFYPIPYFRTIIRLDAKATMKPFIPRKKFRFFFPLNEYHFTLSAHPVGMGGLWMPKKFNLYTKRIL